jgi:hypothetical protein
MRSKAAVHATRANHLDIDGSSVIARIDVATRIIAS